MAADADVDDPHVIDQVARLTLFIGMLVCWVLFVTLLVELAPDQAVDDVLRAGEIGTAAIIGACVWDQLVIVWRAD